MFDSESTAIRRLKRTVRDLERRVAAHHAKSIELARAVSAMEERTRHLQENMRSLECRVLTLERRLWNFGLLVTVGLSALVGLLVAIACK